MKRLVIANRGEIARRILKSARKMGMRVAVVCAPDDKHNLVILEADAVLDVSSYLSIREIVQVAKAWKADLLHPGYGFLSESSDFAKSVEQAGITFVGPTPENMRALGGKESAKKKAIQLGVPVLQAAYSSELQGKSLGEIRAALEAKKIISPYLVKASGGGGGRGMRIVEEIMDLPDAIARAAFEARNAFNDDTIFVERYLAHPRHIEAQVFGDGQGGGVFLGERECSLQRRHQKVIEEAPSPSLDSELRKQLCHYSMTLVKHTQYRGAGTVEFLLDSHRNLSFLEMNTRLQVEHPVTEEVYGVDLVQAQLELALGHWPFGLGNPGEEKIPEAKGVAFEARLLAEDPRQNFLPTPGPLLLYKEPLGLGVRVDSGVTQGSEISGSYDSLIAKIIVHGAHREEALDRMQQALQSTVVMPCTTNLPFLQACFNHPDFLVGNYSTSWIAQHLDVLNNPLLPSAIVEFLNKEVFLEQLCWAMKHSTSSSDSHPFSSDFKVTNRVTNAHLPLGHPSLTRGFRVVRVNEHDFMVMGPDVQECLKRSMAEPVTHHNGMLQKHLTEVVLQPDGASLPMKVLKTKDAGLLIQCFGEILRCDNPELPWELRYDIMGTSQDSVLTAPMAGKVLEVQLAESQRVEKGVLAFVLESMKMQLEIKTTLAGVVEEVYVKAGDMLSSDLRLAKLKPHSL